MKTLRKNGALRFERLCCCGIGGWRKDALASSSVIVGGARGRNIIDIGDVFCNSAFLVFVPMRGGFGFEPGTNGDIMAIRLFFFNLM